MAIESHNNDENDMADKTFRETYHNFTIRKSGDRFIVAELSPYKRHDSVENARKAIREYRKTASTGVVRRQVGRSARA